MVCTYYPSLKKKKNKKTSAATATASRRLCSDSSCRPIQKCNVCIVGAGPAGLACLSAIREPYSLDTLNDVQVNQAARFLLSASTAANNNTNKSRNNNNNNNDKKNKKKTVAVVDPNPTWMEGWKRNFQALDIEFLRSPALAHPDHFDQNALLAYAVANDREDELIESGCFDNRSLLPLGQSQIGLWKLPSAALFENYCLDMTKKLEHDYIQAKVVDIDQEDDGKSFFVRLSNGDALQAEAVILATGGVGRPVVPLRLENVPAQSMFQWTELKAKLQKSSSSSLNKVLVVGGGLTAVQAAHYALRRGKQVALCSRRPLVERNFDIGEEWFDRRTTNKCMSDFYHQPVEERLALLRETRGGGSVPPIYMKELREWESKGKLSRITTSEEPNYIYHKAEDNTVAVGLGPKIHYFDCIVLACGLKPDCTIHPLIQKLRAKWPIKAVGGFLDVSEDLEWTKKKNLFVVGAVGSLNVGPDAGNLMGIRRAASIVANALECRCWLREESMVLSNRFDILWEDDDDATDDETTTSTTDESATSSGSLIGFD